MKCCVHKKSKVIYFIQWRLMLEMLQNNLKKMSKTKVDISQLICNFISVLTSTYSGF